MHDQQSIQACVDFIVSLCFDPACTYGDRCRSCLMAVREFLDRIGMPPCPDPECYACRRMS